MTLNEAIEYYDSLAEECRRKASIERNDYMDLRDESAEYSQLSEWLAELAVLREKVNCSELPNSSEQKTGHWIEHKTQIADHTVYTYECSECGNSMLVKPTRFCGHCGAKMEEDNDDSE